MRWQIKNYAPTILWLKIKHCLYNILTINTNFCTPFSNRRLRGFTWSIKGMQMRWQDYRFRFEFPCWQNIFATEIFKYAWIIILLWNLYMKRVRVLKCINCLAWQVYLEFKRKLLKKLIDRGFSRFPRQNQRRVRKKNCVKSFFPPPGQDPR